MSLASRFVTAAISGLSVFRREILRSPADTLLNDVYLEQFGHYEERIMRYRVFWSCYEGSQYDNVHPWANTYKANYSLSRDMRACYSPLFRLGNFWATHVWNGPLDATEQNGPNLPSGLPIKTKNEAIRPALMQLWQDSNFASNKEMIPRLGSIKGDIAIKVEDDTEAGKVRIYPIDAATVRWVRLDTQGNVDAYEIIDRRPDPRIKFDQNLPFTPFTASPIQRTVTYGERCWRDGQTIHYETYLDGALYDWTGKGGSGQWTEDYGFVPMVLIQHMKVLPEYPWGWSEFQGAMVKAREADRVGSDLHTQIRKASDPKFFVAGSRPPATTPKVQRDDSTQDRPQPSVDELPFVYGAVGSACHALVYPLDIQFTSMEIQNQLQSNEKDFPELRFDSARATGDASAKALREVRKTAEAKVHGRRVGYDNALVRAHMMALSIGGMRGYRGYEAFPRGSFEDGKLDHRIGERTVFLMDPLDRTEEKQAILTAWQTAKTAQIPDEFFMWWNDFTPAEIQAFMAAREREMNLQLQQAAALAAIQAQAQIAARAQLPAPAPGE